MKIPGYTLKRKLGQGGMAAVYLAEQESFGREVALKIMVPQLAREQNFAERFQQEARTVARLAHPHIITVYDVGSFKHLHYIAMEYHTGGDLTQRLVNGIEPHEALRITSEMADALAFAHGMDIVHRDIKPDNVLFRAHNNSAILTDFGIAKNLAAGDRLTQTGSTVGTPKYMCPEQARGLPLDGRADLYSLGVMLYEMLTGRLPFMADDPVALAIKHCQDPVPRLPASLGRYQALIDKLLAKEADDRYATGTEVMAAIEQLQKPVASFGPQASVMQANTARVAVVSPPPPPPVGARKAASPAPKPMEAFFTTEEIVKGTLLSRQYHLKAAFSATDYDDFKRQFEKLQETLHDWLEKRGKRAARLYLSIQAHPWIQARIREIVHKSRMENTAFGDLLHQAEVKLHLHDHDDPQGQHVTLSEAGGKLPVKS
jgi:serine/threonine protein kinase